MMSTFSPQLRRLTAHAGLTAAIVTALFAGACSESLDNSRSDTTKPTLNLSQATSTVDSVLALNATVNDNLGIKRVHFDVSGGMTAAYDTVFTSSSTAANFTISLPIPRSIPAGTAMTFIATAFDGAGNQSLPDTLRLAVGNLAPGTSLITSPASGTVVVQGKSFIISISGKSPLKVAALGFQTSGSFPAAVADSAQFSSPLQDSVSVTDTIAVPAGASTGSLVVTPFLRDSLGQRTLGTPITLSVQSPSSASGPPAVDFGTTKRVELTDTIHIDATDPNGITYAGFEVRTASTINSATPSFADSTAFNGTLISVPVTDSLNLPSSIVGTGFSTTIYVKAFARNSAGTRGYAKLSSGVDRVDTLLVVAGSTKALPNGGSVADALYHANSDRLYLTNVNRNTVEIFNPNTRTFAAQGISVGSRPWGITAWPRNHATGQMGDTLLIANSGGTNISYINVNQASLTANTEVYRYPLPNIIVSTVSTEITAIGGLQQKEVKYDFSDRPQYVAATCKTIGNLCGDVILTYSTTPTPGQSLPFDKNNGTLRWENLTRTTYDYQKSHFFFEQAIGADAGRADTIQVVRYDGTNPTVVLLPAVQLVNQVVVPPDTIRTYYALTVRTDRIAFHDTTFVRNSGDFRRAVFGEGGWVTPDSRAMTYDVDAGYVTTYLGFTIPIPGIDRGISQSFNISDFIANNSQRVTGVSTNFDGSRFAIRGDSTYVIDNALRLQGILPTTASNSGIDFHPELSSSRVVFTASADANIEVWDACHFQRLSTIPIRDPIIGPIKSSVKGGNIILFGVTAKGVVIMTLPNTFPGTCSF
jgi:hypothetical protein